MNNFFKKIDKQLITNENIELSPGKDVMVYNAKCFLAFSLSLEHDETDEMRKIAKEIIDYIHEKYPEVGIEFFNFKDEKYVIELGDFVYNHPFIKKIPFNRDCFIDSLKAIMENKEFQKNGRLKSKYFACSYALIIYGWLGTCIKEMTQKEFLTWMKEEKIKTRKKSQFSLLLSGLKKTFTFPNWDIDVEDAIKSASFEKQFLKIYWGIMISKYHSLEEMKEAKSE